jgi:hypothetical protein
MYAPPRLILDKSYSPVFWLSSGCAQVPDPIVEVTVNSI